MLYHVGFKNLVYFNVIIEYPAMEVFLMTRTQPNTKLAIHLICCFNLP